MLSSGTQHTMSPEFGGKWRTVSWTRFPGADAGQIIMEWGKINVLQSIYIHVSVYVNDICIYIKIYISNCLCKMFNMLKPNSYPLKESLSTMKTL